MSRVRRFGSRDVCDSPVSKVFCEPLIMRFDVREINFYSGFSIY